MLVIVATPMAAILLLPRYAGPTTRLETVAVEPVVETIETPLESIPEAAVPISTDRWAAVIGADRGIVAAVTGTRIEAATLSGYVLPTGGGYVFVQWNGEPGGYFFVPGTVGTSRDALYIESPRRDRIDRFSFAGDALGRVEIGSPLLSSASFSSTPYYVATFLGGEIVVGNGDMTVLPSRGVPALAALQSDTGHLFAAYATGAGPVLYTYGTERGETRWRPVDLAGEPTGGFRHAIVPLDAGRMVWHTGAELVVIEVEQRTGVVVPGGVRGSVSQAVPLGDRAVVVVYGSENHVGAVVVVPGRHSTARIGWNGIGAVERSGQTLFLAGERSVQAVRFVNS